MFIKKLRSYTPLDMIVQRGVFCGEKKKNINKVLESIQQLRMNRLVQMTTEKIIFLAEQVEPIKAPIQSKDEVTSQSLENLSAISELFESKRTGVIH